MEGEVDSAGEGDGGDGEDLAFGGLGGEWVGQAGGSGVSRVSDGKGCSSWSQFVPPWNIAKVGDSCVGIYRLDNMLSYSWDMVEWETREDGSVWFRIKHAANAFLLARTDVSAKARCSGFFNLFSNMFVPFPRDESRDWLKECRDAVLIPPVSNKED